MATLRLDYLTFALRSFRLELTLDVAGTTALVGPSGAGKTTVLHAIAGLRKPDTGTIAVDDAVWFASGTNLPPDRRAVGLVFQDYALFPHMTVRQNVEYAANGNASELLERFGIAQLVAERPRQLSGGERQRVALARALAREPQVLLLDEPLAALDAHTKTQVRAELHELLGALDIPVVLVTHDFEDAAALADNVGVLVDGTLRQLATPRELVARPADPFVASFTGANVLTGWATPAINGSTRVLLDDGTVIATADPARGEVTVAVYPWDITVATAAPDDSALNVIHAPVRSVVELGNRVRVTLGPVSAEVTAESASRLGLRPGQDAYASFKATGTRVLAGSVRALS
ncbi:MAG TPA: ATP-binding cassette domain-containing protein [Gaiellaceae bacterium]